MECKPELLDALLTAVASDVARVRFGAAKALRNLSQYAPDLIVSVKATPSFQPAHSFDAVGVWTNNDNDQGAGEAGRKLTGWRLSVKRAGSAGKNFAISAGCR